jgi:hypothetical protein
MEDLRSFPPKIRRQAAKLSVLAWEYSKEGRSLEDIYNSPEYRSWMQNLGETLQRMQ